MIIINDVNNYKGILGNSEEYESLIRYAEKKKKNNLLWLFKEGAGLVTQIVLFEANELTRGIMNDNLREIINRFEELIKSCDTAILISQG